MSRPILHFTEAARGHIDSIGEYTEATWGIEQRDLYLGQLYAGFQTIRKAPLAGRNRDDLAKGLKSKLVRKHIAYYFVKKGMIVIIGVLHERMDPARHL